MPPSPRGDLQLWKVVVCVPGGHVSARPLVRAPGVRRVRERASSGSACALCSPSCSARADNHRVGCACAATAARNRPVGVRHSTLRTRAFRRARHLHPTRVRGARGEDRRTRLQMANWDA